MAYDGRILKQQQIRFARGDGDSGACRRCGRFWRTLTCPGLDQEPLAPRAALDRWQGVPGDEYLQKRVSLARP